MALTDASVRAARPREDGKPRKLADGGSLILVVMPSGAKYWRYRYLWAGKDKWLSLGVYPEVGLRDAREARDAARAQLKAGTDPAIARKQAKVARITSAARTLQVVYQEWLPLQRFRERTLKKAEWLYRRHIGRAFGTRPVDSIARDEIVAQLKALERDGKLETAHRFRQRLTEILDYARRSGYLKVSPATDLEQVIAPLRHRHHAAIITPAGVGELLRAIEGYQGAFTTRSALQLAAYLFVRPGELRAVPWTEIDLHRAEWRVPDERLKEGGFHIVPLPRQAVSILRHLHAYTGSGTYVFPAVGNSLRPMSDNTLNAALRRLGYTRENMVAHGFRTIASTFLTELGYHPEVIELQLAHVPKDKVRADYNRAAQIKTRREMMQAYADYLDGLRESVKAQTA
jgi:integrase